MPKENPCLLPALLPSCGAQERCRLTSVRLEEMLARRGGREEQNRQDQYGSSSPRPPQLNPPLPELSKVKRLRLYIQYIHLFATGIVWAKNKINNQ